MYNDNIPTSQKEQIINQRISNIIIPSQELEPLFSFYPTPTKYQYPISYSTPTRDQLAQLAPQVYATYTSQTFNPGSRAPWEGYVNAINIESELKTQTYPMTKSNLNVYVPDSRSDLYQYPSLSSNYTSIQDQGIRRTTSNEPIFNSHTRNNKDAFVPSENKKGSLYGTN